jgi:N-carbamoyl-L-amino-acid hydrolase
VVEGVQGISWTELTIRGRSAHAGTTPMRKRRDAGYVAAAVNVAARQLAADVGGTQVATVGRFEVRPDLVNVVPNTAVLTVDLRNTDDAVLQEAERRLAAEVERLAAAEGVTVESRSLARFAPVEFDAATVDLVEATAQRLGRTTRRMPSGAGHDAQMLARICPAAMIFTPSVGGLSHNIAEHTHPADVTAGADVLLQTLLALAGASDPA